MSIGVNLQGRQYQVSEPLTRTLQAAVEDNQITDSEYEALASASQSEDDASFLNSLRTAESAGFEPNQLVFNSGYQPSQLELTLTNYFDSATTIHPDDLPNIQGALDQLRHENPEEAERLQNVFYARIDSSLRTEAESLDSYLSEIAISEDGGMTEYDQLNVRQRVNTTILPYLNFQAGGTTGVPHPDAIEPNTRLLTMRTLDRASAINAGDLSVPSARGPMAPPEGASESRPREFSWAAGVGVTAGSLSRSNGQENTSQNYQILTTGAAGAFTLDNRGTQAFGYGVIDWTLQGNPPDTMGPSTWEPRGRDDQSDVRFEVGAGIARENLEFSAFYNSERGLGVRATMREEDYRQFHLVTSEEFTGVDLRFQFFGGGLIG